MKNTSYKAAIQIITLNIFVLSLSGCSADNYRMQKYDPKVQASNNQAIVVVGTKNLTFIDFNKVTASDLKSKPKAIKSKSETTKVEPTTSPKAEQKTTAEASDISADPNKTNYPSIKLSELFKRKPATRSTNNDYVASQPALNAEHDDKYIDQQNSYRVLKANRLLNYGYANSVYTVEPGTYYISYAYSDEGNVERHTQAPGLTETGTVEYGAFEVKAGDVVYLGDIEAEWLSKDPSKMFHISGNLNLVKQELIAANHSALAEKLQTATFLPSGTPIKVN